jgi:hypothetical protein
MRADIHDGPEQMLQSEAGYIEARPLTANSAKPLATHGRTIHWVKIAALTGYWPLPVYSGERSLSGSVSMTTWIMAKVG